MSTPTLRRSVPTFQKVRPFSFISLSTPSIQSLSPFSSSHCPHLPYNLCPVFIHLTVHTVHTIPVSFFFISMSTPSIQSLSCFHSSHCQHCRRSVLFLSSHCPHHPYNLCLLFIHLTVHTSIAKVPYYLCPFLNYIIVHTVRTISVHFSLISLSTPSIQSLSPFY